jgi:hypothetical protein
MHEIDTHARLQDLGLWLERVKKLSEDELTRLVQSHFRVIDEVGPPYAIKPRSLAMRELLRLGL